MLDFILLGIVYAALVVFCISAINLTGVREELIMESPSNFFTSLFRCDFCLSFWTTYLLCFFVFICTQNLHVMVYTFLIPPFIKKLI